MNRLTPTLIASAVMMFAVADAMAKESLPQLDSSSFPNQLFWLAVTFATLYLVVSRFIVPNVSEVLSAREATIADAIAKAEAYKMHANQAKGNFEADSQAARTKAAEMLTAAQTEAAQKQSEAMAALDATLEAQTASAQSALTNAVNAARKEMDAAVSDLARAIAEKLLGSKVDAKSLKAKSAA